MSQKMIKDLKVGTVVKLADLDATAHKTTPPARFSEVSLIKKLSELGIGRPATFNSIVTLIQDRGYVMKVGGRLVPTFLGFAVVNLLMAKFPEYVDYGYTASMEEKLEEVADRKVSREQFLAQFWNGKTGFAAKVEDLMKTIDYEEVRKLSTIDLHNGYSVVFNKFGAWLQDDSGTPNDKGFLPSAKIGDDDLIDEYLDPEVCRAILEKSSKASPSNELGILSSGTYAGWTVTARDGKYGEYLQALPPETVAAHAKGEKTPPKAPKAVNHKLPEGKTLKDVTLEDVESLFAEVKLPRQLSDQLFVGLGKRGAYLGRKASAKARKAVFVSLPEGMDPRTITLAEATKVWEDSKK